MSSKVTTLYLLCKLLLWLLLMKFQCMSRLLAMLTYIILYNAIYVPISRS